MQDENSLYISSNKNFTLEEMNVKTNNRNNRNEKRYSIVPFCLDISARLEQPRNYDCEITSVALVLQKHIQGRFKTDI